MSWMVLDEDLGFELSQTPTRAHKRTSNSHRLLQKVVGSTPPWVTFYKLLASDHLVFQKCCKIGEIIH